MNNNKNNEDILNDCLESILSGESPEKCIDNYLDRAEELGPLLRTAMAAKRASDVSPGAEFRARARYEYRQAVAEACSRKKSRGFHWSWRLSTAVPLAAAVMLMSGGGVMAASAGALPGQPLYAVKLSMEQMQLNLTLSDAGKTKVYAALAENRVNELVAIAGSGSEELVGETALRLENTLSNVTGYMQTNANRSGGSFDTAGSQEGIVPPPATTSVESAITGDVKVPLVSGIAPGPGATLVTNVSNIDPALLGILQQYASRDLAKLESALSELPDSSHQVLQHAVDDYNTILNTQAAPAG
jgi:hypothetical protein